MNVWDASPAHVAGLKSGDIIEEINFVKLFDKDIETVRAFFESTSISNMKTTVQRDNQKLYFEIDMQKRIL